MMLYITPSLPAPEPYRRVQYLIPVPQEVYDHYVGQAQRASPRTTPHKAMAADLSLALKRKTLKDVADAKRLSYGDTARLLLIKIHPEFAKVWQPGGHKRRWSSV